MDLIQKYPPITSFLNEVPRLDTQVITGYFINLMKWKFSALRNLRQDALRKPTYLWRPDDKVDKPTTPGQTKGILITSALDYDPTDAQQRPAIAVSRNSWQLSDQQSIGNRVQIPTNLLGNGHDPNFEATMGQNQYLYLVNGSHAFYCVADQGASCEVLGFEIWETLLEYSAVIRRDLGLHSLLVSDLPKVGKLEESTDNYVIPVLITYSFHKSNILRQESPVLKSISNQISLV